MSTEGFTAEALRALSLDSVMEYWNIGTLECCHDKKLSSQSPSLCFSCKD